MFTLVGQARGMANYLRARAPGGTFFFTVNIAHRDGALLLERIDALRAAWAVAARERPFVTRAVVVLPDHLHAVWTLPPGDGDFSTRWKRIKREFSAAVGGGRPLSASQAAKGEVGIWQRRFWERCIRDEAELAAVSRYVWGNPVRHGLVRRAVDWPYSSIHREIAAGRLPREGI